MYIRANSLHQNIYRGRVIEGTNTLTGDMDLLALGAVSNLRSTPDEAKLSYIITKGLLYLIKSAERVQNVRLVGYSGKGPEGLLATIDNVEVLVGKIEQGLSDPQLIITARTFMGQKLLNYQVGIASALYLLMNHKNYPEVAESLGELLSETTGTEAFEIKLAKLSDTISYYLEAMMSGTGSDKIAAVEVRGDEPGQVEYNYDGGEELKSAFTSNENLAAFLGTEIKHVEETEVIYGKTRSVSFVGDLFQKLSDATLRGMHSLITGPTESGKTLCIEEMAMRHEMPLFMIKGFEGLDDTDIIGSWIPDGSGGFEFRYGKLPMAMFAGQKQYERQLKENELAAAENRKPKRIPPAILFIDEINRIKTTKQNLLLGAMNVRNATDDYYLLIPHTQEEITCPNGYFVMIGARNFGMHYVGTNDMDLAAIRRFHRKFSLGYLDEESELKLLLDMTGVDEQIARVMIKVAQATRDQFMDLQAPLGTGSLILWAEELTYVQAKGIKIGFEHLVRVAEDIWYDLVIGRDETGRFIDEGERIIKDNISDSWIDVIGTG